MRQFAKTPLYRGYFQNHHHLRPSFLTFFKKFYLFTGVIAKTPPKGHTISEFFSKKALHSTEGISKTTPRCVAAFGKNSEKHHLPPLTVAIPPLFCYTLFQLFFKNFCLSTADYHFFAPKRSHPLSEVFKKSVTRYTSDYRIFLRFVSGVLKKLKNLPERE